MLTRLACLNITYKTKTKHRMTLCQPFAAQLQLHQLYPNREHSDVQLQLHMHHLYLQKGVLYPHKISRDSQSHCTSYLIPHIFHHQTIIIVALKARKNVLISLPPLDFSPLEAQPYSRRRKHHIKVVKKNVLR